MAVQIEESYEIYEVLNAFPILKQKLQELHFDINDIIEGETVHDYFEKKHLSNEEIKLLVRKINNEINIFLKKGETVMHPENTKQVENLQNDIVLIENENNDENKVFFTQSIDVDDEVDEAFEDEDADMDSPESEEE